MSIHLQKEIAALKKKILSLSARVEEHVREAVRSVERRDADRAQAVVDGDYAIDQLEVEVEEECLKLLALYQPVAIDLRFIIAVLKINTILERIGDIAVNIAERSFFLSKQPPLRSVYFDFPAMADKTQEMLKQSLDSLVNIDARLAREVCVADDVVDAMNRDMYNQVSEALQKYPEQSQILLHQLSISRHLERIADLATNIAEDVIYLAEGEIVRHRTEIYHAQSAH